MITAVFDISVAFFHEKGAQGDLCGATQGPSQEREDLK